MGRSCKASSHRISLSSASLEKCTHETPSSPLPAVQSTSVYRCAILKFGYSTRIQRRSSTSAKLEVEMIGYWPVGAQSGRRPRAAGSYDSTRAPRYRHKFPKAQDRPRPGTHAYGFEAISPLRSGRSWLATQPVPRRCDLSLLISPAASFSATARASAAEVLTSGCTPVPSQFALVIGLTKRAKGTRIK